MPRRRKPKRGDFVSLVWVDITHEPTETSDSVRPFRFESRGWYLGTKDFTDRGEFHLLTTARDLDDGGHYGVEAFPVGCVRSIAILESVPKSVPTRRAKVATDSADSTPKSPESAPSGGFGCAGH